MTVHTSFLKFAGRGNAAVVTPLSVDATASVRSGNAPLTVAFAATSLGGSGASKTYAWAFGDGTTATGPNVSKTYSTPGTFSATVTVSDGTSSASDTLQIVVGSPAQPLAASFSASPTSGASPLTVRFTTTPRGGTGSYTVTVAFGDNTTGGGTSTTKVYSTPGTYTATATVSDGVSTTSLSLTLTVTQPVVTPLIATLTPASASGSAPYSVAFAGSASGGTPPYTYAYSFGDGGSSTLQNPTYSFQNAGTYTVTLTVRDGTRVATVSSTVTVTGAGSSAGDFASWTNKTVPPNGDWGKYASLVGNPTFDATKLSTDLQTYRNKALVYHRRLQLKKGETTTLPGTSTTKGYIAGGRDYQYGQAGGGDRDWYTAMREGRSGGLPNIRDFSRFAMPFIENALHIFQLTHDLTFLDLACWWFEGYWDAMLYNCDATASFSGSGKSRSVSVTVNVNKQYGRYRKWLLTSYNDTVDDKKSSNWSAVKYWGSAGAPMNQNWKSNTTMTGDRTSRLCLFFNDGSISNDGANHGTVQVLEDGLLTGVWGRLLRAVYLNIGNSSPKNGSSYYAEIHAMMKCYVFDHWLPLWQDDYGIRKAGFQKFNKHPFMYDELSHSFINIARFYWHLYGYAKDQEAATTGSTKATWTSRASDYMSSFVWMASALAHDLLYYDLKDQVRVDPDITAADKYDEDVMPFVYPHAMGTSGYDLPYEGSTGKSWGQDNGWGWGFLNGETSGNRRNNAHIPKTIYFTQQLDTALDMYLCRYWEDLSDTDKTLMKTRAGRYSTAKDAFLWGQKYMNGVAAIVSYAISWDPADGSRGKRFWNQIGGSSRVQKKDANGKVTQTAVAANWVYANRHNLQTQGANGGGNEEDYDLGKFLGYNVAILALAFQPNLTGTYRNKFKDAYALEKAAQGGWSVGNTDNPTESSLELLVHLLSGKG